jgi:menaquinone-specific isochorismate synthase
MNTLTLNITETHAATPLTEAHDALRAELLSLLESGVVHKSARRIVRLQVPVEPTDLFAWLHAQPHAVKLYWSERKTDHEVAAVGVADMLASNEQLDMHAVIDTLQARLATAAPDVRFYGGFRFEQRNASDPAWQRFGAYHFVLPQFELCRTGATTTLVWNLVLDDVTSFELEGALDVLSMLTLPAPNFDDVHAQPTERIDLPDRAGWQHNIERALALFDEGVLKKIVLARKAVFTCDAPLDPVALLQRLKAVTPNSFHFCFQPATGVAFVGATPERLYGRIGRTIMSEAIASTRPNGATVEDTQRLGDELLRSEKDLREHIFVRESIRADLEPLCTSLHVAPQPTLLKLKQRQHLLSAVEGELADGVTDADLLCSLHPTPAVGGEPTARALDYIMRLEPFDRGWYAGPLGWIAADSAEFAVAIRSGLVEGERMALYSGAGIVAGSTPQSEWDEIENKISDFVGVLQRDT